MKLMELLEQGKFATCCNLSTKYIYSNGKDILTDSNTKIMVSYQDLISDDWYEYDDTKVNFDIPKDDGVYYTIDGFGCICDRYNANQHLTEKHNDNFNMFHDKELAEYINKKQLLERKLMIFSYLNGAEEIDWEDYNIRKFNTDMFKDVSEIDKRYTGIESSYSTKCFNEIYFKTEEIARKALELYQKDIENVLKLSMKFGF